MDKRLNIAVVGAGISGLSAAWLLSRGHNVTLYEQSSHLGGHANTVDVEPRPGETLPVDTGFIVYNPPNYPNFCALLDHLAVPTQHAPMTFALSLDNASFEYSGTDLNGFFGQRRNLLRADHWQLLAEISRFFKTAMRRLDTYPDHTSLGAFLAQENYSPSFVQRHIIPMGAAIWSSSARQMLEFPANAFIAFYANHAMLRFFGRAKWRTVAGGSRAYVKALLADAQMELAGGVARIHRRNNAVLIAEQSGILRRFDHVVMATHADEALGLLADADLIERNSLDAFPYQTNTAILHSDPRFMPKRRRLWSSWNYLMRGKHHDAELSVTYWMNKLQSLPGPTNYFVTLNPPAEMHPRAVHKRIEYAHPLFDHRAIRTQSKLWALQGRNNTWFAGAYLGYGFHEDGLQTGLKVAEMLGGVRRPWQVENENGRIAPLRFEGFAGRAAAE